jgi:hypothetical protein
MLKLRSKPQDQVLDQILSSLAASERLDTAEPVPKIINVASWQMSPQLPHRSDPRLLSKRWQGGVQLAVFGFGTLKFFGNSTATMPALPT